MKKTLAAILLASMMVMLVGCSSSTQYGDCVGLGEEQNPNLKYRISAQNVAVGILFFSLVIPPVVVVADEFYCPVGVK
jgi:hypothetical protein